MNYFDGTLNGFYQSISKVFYGIAAADQLIRKEDVKTLTNIIQKEWIPLDDRTDDFGTDAAFQVGIVFIWLVENDWDIDYLLDAFKEYTKEYPSLFTLKINALILKKAVTIADSFHGINRRENVYLGKLESIFNATAIEKV